jgi:hypothetical protein
MIQLEFRGWFQCRLATDPDPYDEPRGVSGYAHAYAGEPDLDRVIHFQPPAFIRRCCPPLGVSVYRVTLDDIVLDEHPLVGATVELLDNPKFEGRNGVVAGDGEEPIWPFHLRIQRGEVVVERGISPLDRDFPYREFFAVGFESGATVAKDVAEETEITDIEKVWRERLSELEHLALGLSGAELIGIKERIAMLRRWVSIAPSPGRFFPTRMKYDYALRSPPRIVSWPPEYGRPLPNADWRVKFWLGAWDADVLAGFCKGVLEIATLQSPGADWGITGGEGVRRDDREGLTRRSSSGGR